MWCRTCGRETDSETCEICGAKTEEDLPIKIFWCSDCNAPVIIQGNDKIRCTSCNKIIKYMATDIRPVFPKERYLVELLWGEPLKYRNDSVWCSNNKYYINGEKKLLNSKVYEKANIEKIVEKLNNYDMREDQKLFRKNIDKFIEINKFRLNYLEDEAFSFINETANSYDETKIIVSFSGGKDSTVTANLVIRALNNPSIVHIFGDTTLEFPVLCQMLWLVNRNLIFKLNSLDFL